MLPSSPWSCRSPFEVGCASQHHLNPGRERRGHTRRRCARGLRPLSSRHPAWRNLSGQYCLGSHQNFSEAISFKAALSSIASANSFFSRRFFSSRGRSRLASENCIPSYRLRQLYNVASLIPYCRQRSAGFAPAWCSRRIAMIRSSRKPLPRHVRSPRTYSTLRREI